NGARNVAHGRRGPFIKCVGVWFLSSTSSKTALRCVIIAQSRAGVQLQNRLASSRRLKHHGCGGLLSSVVALHHPHFMERTARVEKEQAELAREHVHRDSHLVSALLST